MAPERRQTLLAPAPRSARRGRGCGAAAASGRTAGTWRRALAPGRPRRWGKPGGRQQERSDPGLFFERHGAKVMVQSLRRDIRAVRPHYGAALAAGSESAELIERSEGFKYRTFQKRLNVDFTHKTIRKRKLYYVVSNVSRSLYGIPVFQSSGAIRASGLRDLALFQFSSSSPR